MQVELTITEIAARLRVSERTALRRIADGTLSAERRGSNRYLVDLDDIAAISPREWLKSHDERILELERQVADMKEQQEQRLHLLEYRMANIERRMDASESTPEPLTPVSPHALPRYEKVVRTTSQSSGEVLPVDIPPESIQYREFAARYHINPNTFRDHIIKGIRGEKVDATMRDKPGRPGEHEYWLSPEQQEEAVEFLRRHGKLT